MKPVFQSIVSSGRGDCFSACLASLLELPIHDVPNFRALEADSGTQMMTLARQWLYENFGLSLVGIYMGAGAPESGEDFRLSGAIKGTPCIGAFTSPNVEGANHAVVGEIDEQGLNFILTHDPNRNGKPIDTYPLFLYFLVSLQPHVNNSGRAPATALNPAAGHK